MFGLIITYCDHSFTLLDLLLHLSQERYKYSWDDSSESRRSTGSFEKNKATARNCSFEINQETVVTSVVSEKVRLFYFIRFFHNSLVKIELYFLKKMN